MTRLERLIQLNRALFIFENCRAEALAEFVRNEMRRIVAEMKAAGEIEDDAA